MTTEENGKERSEDGKFQKGNKASMGRGPNKVSTKVKESIVNFLENNVDAIQESFDQLGPKGKLDFIAEILPYATPKLSSVQSEVEQTISGGITITWEEPKLPVGPSEGSDGKL
jgi:hypothetical protein